MGGPGSTRWRNHQRKRQVEECLALDLRDLGRLGILSSPSAVAGRFDWNNITTATLPRCVHYALGPLDGNERELALLVGEQPDPSIAPQLVNLEYSQIGCAGRWLARCPECGERRVRRLFLPPKSTRFACRWCHNIMYNSVQRYDHRVDRIAKRLRAGDLSVVDEYSTRGRKPGYTGFCSDRLLLAGFAKAFPEVVIDPCELGL